VTQFATCLFFVEPEPEPDNDDRSGAVVVVIVGRGGALVVLTACGGLVVLDVGNVVVVLGAVEEVGGATPGSGTGRGVAAACTASVAGSTAAVTACAWAVERVASATAALRWSVPQDATTKETMVRPNRTRAPLRARSHPACVVTPFTLCETVVLRELAAHRVQRPHGAAWAQVRRSTIGQRRRSVRVQICTSTAVGRSIGT
jgi:hypothetical protein